MPRIVSLLPSSTEIVDALGQSQQLVGRSHECDFPATVRDLPVCTAPKFDPDGTSYQIDQRVKALLQEAVSVYRVDAALLERLAPDLIITQAQCEVCAVSLADVQEAAQPPSPTTASTFTYLVGTGWGESEGTHRYREDPAEKTADIHAAVEHLRQRDPVDLLERWPD